jgi:hypothetical protein
MAPHWYWALTAGFFLGLFAGAGFWTIATGWC